MCNYYVITTMRTHERKEKSSIEGRRWREYRAIGRGKNKGERRSAREREIERESELTQPEAGSDKRFCSFTVCF